MTCIPTEHADLAARLRELEDKEALRALMIQGWSALDRKDWRTWIGCWTEDAVLEFGPWDRIHGREAILAKVAEAESPYVSMQHHILNMLFEVNGDRATGIGYLWFVAVTESGGMFSPTPWAGPTTGSSSGTRPDGGSPASDWVSGGPTAKTPPGPSGDQLPIANSGRQNAD